MNNKEIPEKWWIEKCNNKEDWKLVINYFNENCKSNTYHLSTILP